MKLLLDTHIWLWSFLEPERLGPRVTEALKEADNELWLSPISVWEAHLLAERNRIRLEPSPERWILDALREGPMKNAQLNREVALDSRRLSAPTQDLADRFIAGTARVYETSGGSPRSTGVAASIGSCRGRSLRAGHRGRA